MLPVCNDQYAKRFMDVRGLNMFEPFGPGIMSSDFSYDLLRDKPGNTESGGPVIIVIECVFDVT